AVTVQGIVRDPSGAAVADAVIVLTTPERASVGSARSDTQGRFQLTAPAPGRYLLTVSAPGFRDVRQSISVAESQTAAIEIALQIHARDEDVTVTASPGLVEDVRT